MNRKMIEAFAIASMLVAGVCVSRGQEKPPAPPSSPAAQERASADSPRDSARPGLHQRYPRYRIQPNDVLEITFPFTPEFDQKTVVQPDGYITLREVGDVFAEGKSVPDLAQAVKEAYSKVLHEPEINILLRDFEKPYFIVSGEVGKPGKYELRGDTTLAEAVAVAGGFTDRSKHSQVMLFRRDGDNWVEAKRFDVKKMLAKKDLTEDVHLRPGDLVFVPQNGFSKIKPFLPTPGVGMSVSPNRF